MVRNFLPRGLCGGLFPAQGLLQRERSPYDGEQVMNLSLPHPRRASRWEDGLRSSLPGRRISRGYPCCSKGLGRRNGQSRRIHRGLSGDSPLCTALRPITLAHRRSHRQRGPRPFFGRVANFINGELWGRLPRFHGEYCFPRLPISCRKSRGTHPNCTPQRSRDCAPSSSCNGVSGNPRRSKGSGKALRRIPRRLCLGGILNEFFREPDASLILGMTRGQFYSLFLALGGISLIMIAESRARSVRISGPPFTIGLRNTYYFGSVN